MKNLYKLVFISVFVCFFSQAFAQIAGDYQSKANGNWKDATTWQRYNGSGWVNAATAPDFTTNVTIKGENEVTLTTTNPNSYNECVNLTITTGMLLGNEGLYVYGNISVDNNAQIGNVTYKPIIVITSETCQISGTGGYYLGGLWKLDPMDFVGNTTLTIAAGTTVNYNGTADQIFIKNDDPNSNFNITVNGTINCATGTIGNNGYISFDGSNGAGLNSCGGSLTVSATGVVNAGQIYLLGYLLLTT